MEENVEAFESHDGEENLPLLNYNRRKNECQFNIVDFPDDKILAMKLY